MKKSQNSSLGGVENKIGDKTFLEFTVHLLELEYFNPIVFSHDSFWFSRSKYAKVMIAFINLLSFLYSCGITIETEIEEPSDIEIEFYRNIMKDSDMTDGIVCYGLVEIDFTNLNLQNAEIPDNCDEMVFNLVKIYLSLKTGAALSRKAIENILHRQIIDVEMRTIRKQIENITGRKIIKRKDNSYEMEGMT